MGWFWDPPYLFPYEDNLAMVNFVELQKQAADFLGAYARNKQVGTAWPLRREGVDAPRNGIRRAAFFRGGGPGIRAHPELANLDRNKVDVLVVYSRSWPVEFALR